MDTLRPILDHRCIDRNCSRHLDWWYFEFGGIDGAPWQEWNSSAAPGIYTLICYLLPEYVFHHVWSQYFPCLRHERTKKVNTARLTEPNIYLWKRVVHAQNSTFRLRAQLFVQIHIWHLSGKGSVRVSFCLWLGCRLNTLHWCAAIHWPFALPLQKFPAKQASNWGHREDFRSGIFRFDERKWRSHPVWASSHHYSK